jgi:hypothetical protein
MATESIVDALSTAFQRFSAKGFAIAVSRVARAAMACKHRRRIERERVTLPAVVLKRTNQDPSRAGSAFGGGLGLGGSSAAQRRRRKSRRESQKGGLINGK